MKILRLTLIAAMTLTGLVSCSKNKAGTQSKRTTIEGFRANAYTNEAQGNNFYYRFNFKPGGVIEEINASGQKTGQGTWELENDILSSTYTWTKHMHGQVSATIVY